MAYGQYQNNGAASTAKKSDAKDTNTTGVRLTNYDAGKYMNINYWKRTCSLDIGPIPAGVTRSTPGPWDWKASMPTMHMAMSFSSLTVLEEICDEVWDSIKKSGTFTNVGAPCGAELEHLVEINNGSTIGQPDGIYIVMYKDRDQSGHANSYDFYPCTTRVVERNYDVKTGTSTKDITRTQDFKDFRRCIHEAVSALTMAFAHSVREAESADRATITSALAAICAKNDIAVTTQLKSAAPASGGSTGYQKQGGWNKGGNRGNWNGGYKKPYGGNGYQQGGYQQGGQRYGVGGQKSNNDTPPWEGGVEVTLNSPDQAGFNSLY